MLHIVTMSENFPFLFGLDLNMMLKLQKPIPKKIPIRKRKKLNAILDDLQNMER